MGTLMNSIANFFGFENEDAQNAVVDTKATENKQKPTTITNKSNAKKPKSVRSVAKVPEKTATESVKAPQKKAEKATASHKPDKTSGKTTSSKKPVTKNNRVATTTKNKTKA